MHKRTSSFWHKNAERKVKAILGLKVEMSSLSDQQLKDKAAELKTRYQSGESLDHLLVEAFALVREAALRVTGMEHYPVQLMSGIALHEGKIAEQKTGEGKTLVATLPAFLNALAGKGVHVVTVNEYLAKRDASQMGKIHEFLGLSVGVILSDMSQAAKKKAYACDITYVTNSELGFDYLRDNMASDVNAVVQRGLHYAIIDEVDSILIDEARTPLIIAGVGRNVSTMYMACNALVQHLEKGEVIREFSKIGSMLGEKPEESGDFVVNEKEKNIILTEAGIHKIERILGLENYADPGNMELQHIVDQCLRAQHLMHRDKDYVVKDGVIQLVDEFTGRIMDGRQFADGLHQAIEAKEGVTIREENKTIASTTYQCFFNKYEKISGMTGTAYAEKREFRSTYHLKTVVIPTNKPVQRVDRPSVLYPTKRGKYEGVVAEVLEAHKKGQPVLIGTASIKTSEDVSALLSAAGVPHQILNAKQDAKEAEIISRAGVHGAVTVATNMAGRGTDIILDDEARAAGGLKVIGTELHESSRIDDQLRGRAGRQGDPGESVFFISAEDDMIRLFTRDRFSILLETSGVSYNEPVGGAMFAKYVAQAQRRVEDEHYGMRKNVLDYDLVNDKQRELIYAERRRLLAGEDVHEEFRTCLKSYVNLLVAKHTHDGVVDKEAVLKEYRSVTGAVVIPMGKNSELSSDLKHHILALHRVRSNENEGMSRKLERFAILRSIDAAWTEQLSALECLRQNIWYLSLAQIDPKSAYAMQAFELYESMRANVHRMSVYAYFNHYNVQTQKTVLKINKEGV